MNVALVDADLIVEYVDNSPLQPHRVACTASDTRTECYTPANTHNNTANTNNNTANTANTTNNTANTNNNTANTEEYQIQFVDTLQYSSPEAFTGDLRISYRKGVVLAVGGMDPDTDYVRVSLTVALTSAAQRRLLQAATLDVATTVRLDSATQVASAVATVNSTTLAAAIAVFDSTTVLTAMTPVLPTTTAVATTAVATTAVATTAAAQEETTPVPVEAPKEELNMMLVGLVAGGAVLFVLLLVCCGICMYRPQQRFEQIADSDEEEEA